MTAGTLHAMELFHGAVALVATAAIAWAAVAALRGRLPKTPLAALAAALAILAGATGLTLDGAYRSRLRVRVFAHSRELGWLFERKQHLAFGAIVLALGATFVLFALRTADGNTSPHLTRAARRALVASALRAAASSIASILVAQHHRL